MSRAIDAGSPPPVHHASRGAAATARATARQRERTGLATAESPQSLASVFRYVTEYRGEFSSTRRQSTAMQSHTLAQRTTQAKGRSASASATRGAPRDL